MCSQIAPACSARRSPIAVAIPPASPRRSCGPEICWSSARCELALVGGLLRRVEAVADDDAVAGPHERIGRAVETAQRGRSRPQTMPMSMSATSPVGEVAPS